MGRWGCCELACGEDLEGNKICTIFAVQTESARVAELVDALVSGASVQKTCRFDSCPGHSLDAQRPQFASFKYAGGEIGRHATLRG